MSGTYKATGINLKATAFGESDRLLTILTPEYGLIRAIAPGSRKHKSSLGGRSAMFVVNELLIASGRSLDKITQAQTIQTYPGLSQDLGKLAASQYLAEMVLVQALSEQSQVELYELFTEHLTRLETVPKAAVLAHLSHGIFQLLALAGLTPQVQECCLSGRTLHPDFTDSSFEVGFSDSAGGIICLSAVEALKAANPALATAAAPQDYETIFHHQEIPTFSHRLNAAELSLLQQLLQPEITTDSFAPSWLVVEQVLRSYTQYHFGRSIRSATLLDSYFAVTHNETN